MIFASRMRALDYFATVREFDGCMSHGDTYAEAFENILIAMKGWIETKIEIGAPVPEPFSEGRYSGKFVLRRAAARWLEFQARSVVPAGSNIFLRKRELSLDKLPRRGMITVGMWQRGTFSACLSSRALVPRRRCIYRPHYVRSSTRCRPVPALQQARPDSFLHRKTCPVYGDNAFPSRPWLFRANGADAS